MTKCKSDMIKIKAKIEEAFPEYVFEGGMQGAGWCRIFIKYDGVTLGRINFHTVNGRLELYGTKQYCPFVCNQYNDNEAIFFQFDRWYRTGERIEIAHLVPVAIQMQKEHIAEKEKWRNEHPKYNKKGKRVYRAKLNRSWEGMFMNLVNDIMRAE